MLPAELQQTTLYAAGVTASAREPDRRMGADPGADRAVRREAQMMTGGWSRLPCIWR